MLEIIAWVQANGAEILGVWTALVTAASIIVKLTPTPSDDAWFKKFYDFVSRFIALNKKEV